MHDTAQPRHLVVHCMQRMTKCLISCCACGAVDGITGMRIPVSVRLRNSVSVSVSVAVRPARAYSCSRASLWSVSMVWNSFGAHQWREEERRKIERGRKSTFCKKRNTWLARNDRATNWCARRCHFITFQNDSSRTEFTRAVVGDRSNGQSWHWCTRWWPTPINQFFAPTHGAHTETGNHYIVPRYMCKQDPLFSDFKSKTQISLQGAFLLKWFPHQCQGREVI